jgi:hypothetical protein
MCKVIFMRKILPTLAFALLLVSCSQKQPQATAFSDRLNWNVATLKGAYEKIGRKNAKWNEAAESALTEFANMRAGITPELSDQMDSVGDSATTAAQAGCDDPMVRYLYCRFSAKVSQKPLKELQDQFRQMAADLEGSGYAPLRKFYANMRASYVLWENHDKQLWPEVHNLRMTAFHDLGDALSDKAMPVEEVEQAGLLLFDAANSSEYQLTNAYNAIEKPLFKNWPGTAAAFLLKAEFFYEWAWKARGSGYANQISEDQWKLFSSRLAESEKALDKAWPLNTNDAAIPSLMIKLCEGQQKARPEMEKWFLRAMNLNTNNYDACRSKLHFLYPQWYGSRADMIEFGRQCVQSDVWGGDVPLILMDAHYDYARYLPQEQQDDYWRQPDVWPDVKAAYDKFFQLNPAAKNLHNNYARYAYLCGQWKVFLEQITLSGGTSRDFFGGQEEFDKMVGHATEEDSKTGR